MNDEINYKANPLHGVGLKTLIVELVNYYGFDILFAYLNINCFKINPSIESSVKFLKKADWAREKVEAFYMYEFKNLPRASTEQFQLPPRDRIVPEDQVPGEPAVLSLEDAEVLRQKRAKKAAAFKSNSSSRNQHKTNQNNRNSSHQDKRTSSKSGVRKSGVRKSVSSGGSSETSKDPWAKWRKK